LGSAFIQKTIPGIEDGIKVSMSFTGIPGVYPEPAPICRIILYKAFVF
jgi:hypothetical protein